MFLLDVTYAALQLSDSSEKGLYFLLVFLLLGGADLEFIRWFFHERDGRKIQI